MGECVVVVSFDIFKIEKEGPLWHGTANTLDEAKERIQLLAKTDPGEYLIFNARTGEHLTIRAGDQRSD